MKKIKLFGDLQKFKSSWDLHVKTPGEALRAIEANRPGFLAACDDGDYIAILVDMDNQALSRQVTLENSSAPWANEVLVVVPRASGEWVAAAGIIAAFAYVGVTVGPVLAAVIAVVVNVAIAVAIGAIANLITGKKGKMGAKETESYESKPSFVSNGPVNVVRAGHPYPIIAGRFLCGSIVLSSQIHIKDIPV